MFFFILGISSYKDRSYIDGIKNVQLVSEGNQTDIFQIIKDNIILFVQDNENISVNISRKFNFITNFHGARKVSRGTKIIAKTFSQNVTNYLISFYDAKDCDSVYYSNLPNDRIRTFQFSQYKRSIC